MSTALPAPLAQTPYTRYLERRLQFRPSRPFEALLDEAARALAQDLSEIVRFAQEGLGPIHIAARMALDGAALAHVLAHDRATEGPFTIAMRESAALLESQRATTIANAVGDKIVREANSDELSAKSTAEAFRTLVETTNPERFRPPAPAATTFALQQNFGGQLLSAQREAIAIAHQPQALSPVDELL